MSLVILGTAAAGLSLIKRLDREIQPGRRTEAVAVAAAMIGSCLLRWGFRPDEMLSRLLLSVMMGCLLLACITDIDMCQVYNFVWWISGAAAAVLLLHRWVKEGESIGGMWDLSLFCAVQLLVFGRMYGRADCYAFCVCAAAESGLGMGLPHFLMQMVFAFAALTVVQAVRRNIALDGNLNKPVPFLPYVTASFYTMLFYYAYFS